MQFNITSTSFEEGAHIPVRYTCDGDNISPHLTWEGEPKDTVTYALIVEDPDAPAGIFTHWIVYNLPRDCHELEQLIPVEKKLENGAIHGKNDFGKYGYGGPCPPRSEEHRYYFKIFALRKKLAPESANKRDEFYEAIKGKVLAEAQYMGKFKH